MPESRKEWVEYAKQRALALCDAGDCTGAYSSMASDLSSHPETKGHIGISLGMQMLMAGQLSNPQAMRRFIEDFN